VSHDICYVLVGVARLCCVASSHVFDLKQWFQLYRFHAYVLHCREGLQMDVENVIISHSVWLKVLLQRCPHEVFIQWHFDGPGSEHTFVSYVPQQTFVAHYKLDPNNVRLKLLN